MAIDPVLFQAAATIAAGELQTQSLIAALASDIPRAKAMKALESFQLDQQVVEAYQTLQSAARRLGGNLPDGAAK